MIQGKKIEKIYPLLYPVTLNFPSTIACTSKITACSWEWCITLTSTRSPINCELSFFLFILFLQFSFLNHWGQCFTQVWGIVNKMSSVVVFKIPLNFNFCLFCCERHVKQIWHKFFVKSLPKWLLFVHESDFLCFACSCYTHIMLYCEKFSLRKAQSCSLWVSV